MRAPWLVAPLFVLVSCSEKPAPRQPPPYGYGAPNGAYGQGYPPGAYPPGYPPNGGFPPGYNPQGPAPYPPYGSPGRLPYPPGPGYGPPPGPQPYGPPPGTPQPPATVAPPVPVPTAAPTATAAPSAFAGPSEEQQKCLSDAGSADDCLAALKKMVATGASPNDAANVYEKACSRKAKVLGCGSFKSTAVTEADRPTIGLLALCEFGAYESCEDVQTKSTPLKAWLTTNKENGCKKNATALCKIYKECKAKTDWGCKPVTSSPSDQVCGCVPQCKGNLKVTAGSRSWADGSKRGNFVCE